MQEVKKEKHGKWVLAKEEQAELHTEKRKRDETKSKIINTCISFVSHIFI